MLKRLMERAATKAILTTNGFIILIDEDDYEICENYRFFVCVRRGIPLNVMGKKRESRSKPISLSYILMEKKDGFVVDHINRNVLDNRRRNLRYATPSQNAINRRISTKKFTSKYKGVYLHRKTNKWRVCIRKRLGGKYTNIYTRLHENEIDAARDYNRAVKEAYGEFAVLNEID